MPQIHLGHDIKCSNGLVLSYRTVVPTQGENSITIGSTSGTGSTHDYMIGVDTLAHHITINLPRSSVDSAACVVGRTYIIFDKTGHVQHVTEGTHHHITIDAGSGAQINGTQTKVINSNYNSVTLCCVDSTPNLEKWNII
jgi:hypothetical protein